MSTTERQPCPRIVITGSEGTIGTVLKRELATDFNITPVDLRLGHDIREGGLLQGVLPGHRAVVHLAWNMQSENWVTGNFDVGHIVMACNVYEAALKTGVKRVIMASSIHADQYRIWEGPELLSTDRIPYPDSHYGASKVDTETRGRCFSRLGLEVICIRFGGVNSKNKPFGQDPIEDAAWLSHHDCGKLVRLCLTSETVPGNFVILNAVSNNRGRILDCQNPFGWMPQDNPQSLTLDFI